MTIDEDTNIPSGELPSWFAISVKTTHEKRVASLLEYHGYEWLLPLYESRRRYTDRVVDVEVPLFPGYVFGRFAAGLRLPILKIPSVSGIVGIGGTPSPVEDREIAALMQVMQSKLNVLPHPFLLAGRRVRIDGGSLDGLEGVIENVRDRRRLIVSVTLLQRSVAVEIDSGRVSLLPEKPKKANPRPLWSYRTA